MMLLLGGFDSPHRPAAVSVLGALPLAVLPAHRPVAFAVALVPSSAVFAVKEVPRATEYGPTLPTNWVPCGELKCAVRGCR